MAINHVIDRLQVAFFPHNGKRPDELSELINAFENIYTVIKSPENRLPSNGVLYHVSKALQSSEIYKCEEIIKNAKDSYYSKKKIELEIDLPNYTGTKKSFNPDIISFDGKIIVEVEAGQAVDNYRFLKDLFESIIYTKCDYLAIAVRNKYSTYNKEGEVKSSQYDFETICDFMTWLFESRVKVPLKGILIIGY